jgi:hypothetical protein
MLYESMKDWLTGNNFAERPRSALIRHGSIRWLSATELLESRALMALTVPSFTTPLGKPITGTIASFDKSDIGENEIDALSAKIEWGNGSFSNAEIHSVSGTSDKFEVVVPISRGYLYPSTSYNTITVSVSNKPASEPPIKPVNLSGTGIAVVVESTSGSGTTINAVENVYFSGPIGYFSDSGEKEALFSAMINWGDGIASPGQIVKVGQGQYQINGNHTYKSTGNFTLPITVNKQGVSVPLMVISSAATITKTPVEGSFTGKLAPSSDTGERNDDNITRTTFPVFEGNAVPYSVVLLFGRRFDYKQEVLLGRTVAGPDGRWQITAGPMADGNYVISGSMTTTTGQVVQKVFCGESPTATNSGPLVIDTIGLSVVRIQRVDSPVANRKTKQSTGTMKLWVYLEPDSSGFNEETLTNRDNYALQQKFHDNVPLIKPTILSQDADNNPNPDRYADFIRVELLFPKSLLRIPAKLRISGVHDTAGNVLSGVFPTNTQAIRNRKLPYR